LRAGLLALLLLGPARLLAWGGDRRVALLAVPAEDFSAWPALAGLMESYGDLRLTLALTPEMLTPTTQDALAGMLRSGRLELAMRMPGDPVLVSVHGRYPTLKPQDSLNRLALCQERFNSLPGAVAAGFVPSGGAADGDMAPIFQAMSVPWVAVGPGPMSPEGTAGPASASPPFLPFLALKTEGRIPEIPDMPAASGTATTRIVLDEAQGLVPAGSLLALLRELKQQPPPWIWETVAASLSPDPAAPLPGADTPSEAPAAASGSLPSWPGWGEGSWSGSPAQEAAWKAFGTTAAAFKNYQNSGAADLRALEEALDALYAAQSSRYYRRLAAGGSEAARADRELRQQLMTAYRKLKQPVPGGLFVSLLDGPDQAGSVPGAEDVPTAVLTGQGADWLYFQNPAGSLSRAPEGEPKEAAEAWKIAGLRVQWDAASVVFSYKMAALDISTAAAPAAGRYGNPELGRVVLDTYIDINQVPGAGSCTLLEGRGAFVFNRDCWEFALSVSPAGGILLRSASGAAPAFLASAKVSVDPQQRSIRASVPRSWLRGNPARWGYISAAFAARPSATPPAPASPAAVLPGGPLGILAPLESQKTGAVGRRLSALRAQP
jgi:hypothetical protein